MSNIRTDDLLRTLPRVLKNDVRFNAFAEVVAKQIRILFNNMDVVSIYAGIDALPEAVLDILAYDFKVDWYDYTYTLEQKRQTIKESFIVHKHLGTKFAVEKAISVIFPNTTVEEWFEHDGDPYSFGITIVVDDLSNVDRENQQRVISLANYYKNLRSHLGQVKYAIEAAPMDMYCAAGRCGTYIKMSASIDVPEIGGIQS